MFETGAKPRPEATTGTQFAIGGTPVVVGTYSGACSEVALSHNAGCYKERIVVVLLMGRKYHAVAHLATRYGAVVAHNTVVDTGTILDMDVLSKESVAQHCTTFHMTAVAYNTAIDGRGGVDDGRCLGGTDDPRVADVLAMGNSGIVAHISIGDHVVGELGKALHQAIAATIFSPKVGIGDGHAREQPYGTASVLVHNLGRGEWGVGGGR